MQKSLLLLVFLCTAFSSAQDYFLEKYHPFNENIPSPQEFLGYPIGQHHTRHDLMVAYFQALAKLSDRATIEEYGKTYEGRKLIMLTVSSEANMTNLEALKASHLAFNDPTKSATNYNEIPIFINLGYNVHGNEPSGGEASMLAAYTLVASEHPEIKSYRNRSVVFIDPVINPDGRDRHTHWANMYQGNPVVSDPQDAEHNEYWPGGRTNHYWFDLNRDWLLGEHPESRGKLKWYHQWYPNVVTDFHEMGTQSTYFFEPMKANGSFDPIMPKENYEDLNNLFGAYFAKALDSVGSYYFSKEIFDGTYPGYGSSYPDLQGGLGLLFEQASSRGHAQKTAYGEITFPFTIRNQFVSTMATVKASVENKSLLRKYQQDFFKSAISNANSDKVKGYEFYDHHDQNRVKAFIDKLLLHKIKVYKSGEKYVVPTKQPQYRMVQTMFETYAKYRDSVFYDASAWSMANFYNMKYNGTTRLNLGDEISTTEGLTENTVVTKSEYAYIIDNADYNAFATLHYLQSKKIIVSSAFKPFTATTNNGETNFNYGALIIRVKQQQLSTNTIFDIVKMAQEKFNVPIHAVKTGYNSNGIDLGSRYVRPLKTPKAAMLIGTGTRSYDAGEVWHLLDTRVHMPITKIPFRNFDRTKLEGYNTLVMVSGNYKFNPKQIEKIKNWASNGNTLITIGTATKWAIEKGLVKEKLLKKEKDSSLVVRKPYVDAPANRGKENVGGAIFKVDLDTTHPLAFGYHDKSIPVYKNNTVWLAPSKNAYATVAQYNAKPHIDGFITAKNTENYLKKGASLVVSGIGKGRVVLFADNPNFRGAWYGTNRLFLNALFLGNHITVPVE